VLFESGCGRIAFISNNHKKAAGSAVVFPWGLCERALKMNDFEVIMK
jgi:hypothetical protein